MNSFADPLRELQDRCEGTYCLTADDRTLLHNAYWSGNATEISVVLEIMCFDPVELDLPVLLDASSPGSLWINRCDAAQALGGMEDGARILRIMLERETHPVVKFYVTRELIDLEDDMVTPLLDGPIPSNGSPIRRKLWIYGNFERGELTKELALKYMVKLLQDKKRRADWLRDHVVGSN